MNPFQRQSLNIEASQPQREDRPAGANDSGSEHGSDHQNERRPNPADKKPKRQVKPRFRLQPKHLKDSNKGLRLLYNSTNRLKLDQTDNRNETELLNQFLRLYKEWHFNLVPKYDINYFISRCHDFGREPNIRTYLSRMRSVHIGANRWEDFADEEEEEQKEEAKNNTQATQNTQNTQNTTQNNRPNQNMQGANRGPQGLQSTISTQRSQGGWPNQTSSINPNQMRSSSTNNVHYEPLRERTNEVPRTQDIPTQPINATLTVATQDDYVDYDQILAEERHGTLEVAEDPIMDDFEGDVIPPDYEDDNEGPDPFDDEQRIDEEDLERQIKKLKT